MHAITIAKDIDDGIEKLTNQIVSKYDEVKKINFNPNYNQDSDSWWQKTKPESFETIDDFIKFVKSKINKCTIEIYEYDFNIVDKYQF